MVEGLGQDSGDDVYVLHTNAAVGVKLMSGEQQCSNVDARSDPAVVSSLFLFLKHNLCFSLKIYIK